MLGLVSHVVLSFVIIRFTQHLAGKLILWNKSVILFFFHGTLAGYTLQVKHIVRLRPVSFKEEC